MLYYEMVRGIPRRRISPPHRMGNAMKRENRLVLIMIALLLCLLCACAAPEPEPVPEAPAEPFGPALPADREIRAQGFYREDGGFVYVDENGSVLRTPGACEALGTRFWVRDDGTVSILSHTVTLADGRRFLLEDGDIVKAIGLHEYYGDLYFLQPDFSLLCGGSWKGLRFGDDGAYTCGNCEIDAFVNDLVNEVTEPAMTREEKLRAVYAYVFEHTEYQSNNNHVPRGAAASSWTEENMLRLMHRGKGNCYCYASLMYYCAKRLGYYNAKAISGGVMLNNDHGWLEIPVDGVPTVTDPELESKNYSTPGHIFLTPYDQTPWTYYLNE